MPHSFVNTLEHKHRLRTEMRAKRRGHPHNTPASFQAMSEGFLRHIALKEGSVISSYHAFNDEMDPDFLTHALRARGHKIALPIVVGKGLPLAFRHYDKGDVLEANAMGLHEPLATAPLVEPDVMLVPLLAFDPLRNRLGYGGGFYDRTIAGLHRRKPILTVGIAYAYQQLPEILTEPHDIRLDKIVTEINVL
ncbi:MAG: 5-formyltetrahydrofolate cyclo-ligase [Alphaproteobacteria bacterium]